MRAASRMRSAGTPVIASAASGELRSSETKAFHCANEGASQRSATYASRTMPSLTITWASAFMSATLLPGFNCRCTSAWMCGARTRPVSRGSAMMSFAP